LRDANSQPTIKHGNVRIIDVITDRLPI